MRLEHDAKADAVYVYLRDGAYAYGENLDDERRIDYTASGTPIGVELLSVSHGVNIEGLPEEEKVARLLEAENIEVYTEACYASGTSMGTRFRLLGVPVLSQSMYWDVNSRSNQREVLV